MKNLFKSLFPCFFPKKSNTESLPQYSAATANAQNVINSIFFLERLNSYRELLALKSLELCKNQKIYDMCYSHVLHMEKSGNANHDNQFERHDYINWLFCKQVDNRECVAKGYSSPQAYLNAFLNSPKHKDALINPNMTHACIVFSYDKKYLMVFLYELK
jgi:uncharacterized protein YkwD